MIHRDLGLRADFGGYGSAIARLTGNLSRRLPRNKHGADNSRRRYNPRELWVIKKLGNAYDLMSLPTLTVFLFHNRRFDPSYGLTWRRKWRLALQMYRNTRRIETGTSNRAHMAMAAKIFEIPAHVEGVIVEAGCWKGGSTANLSLVADIVGRELVVYDSFEGMPAPSQGDRWANPLGEGAFRGELNEVQSNVARYGVLERCRFRKGWFSETLPSHTEPIVAAFVDVDHQASMHQCVLGLWPHLIDSGYWFIDEYARLDYCALFFSERFWRSYFDRPPPGLMGAGTGIAVGQYFTGPLRGKPPIQQASSVAWTRKDFYGEWDYFPDDVPIAPLPGGPGAAEGLEGWVTTTLTSSEVGERKLAEALAAKWASEGVESGGKPRVAAVADVLAEGEELVGSGRIVEAVDLLAAAGRRRRDPQVELRLVELRHAATHSFDPGPGRSPWPPSFDDPFPDVVGRPPEIAAGDLTAGLLGASVAHHGSLIVRNLFTDEEVAAGVEAIDRSRAAASDDDGGRAGSRWYRPFDADDAQLAAHRKRVVSRGGVWLADSPASTAWFLDHLASAGVIGAITGHLGERPGFSLQKSTMRRIPPTDGFTGWHQDGSFLGPDVRAMNVWVALSRCGVEYPSPGLEIMPKRVEEILPIGDGIGPIAVSSSRVEELARETPVLRPEFAPGDAMLFDERFLHRTYLDGDMTEARYALECWFFALSHFAADYVPFLA